MLDSSQILENTDIAHFDAFYVQMDPQLRSVQKPSNFPFNSQFAVPNTLKFRVY